jgi:hypothetical protein
VSVQASTAVWEFTEAPSKTILVVLLVLADHADRDGRVWVSMANVAEQARVARSTAYEAVHVLKKLGELVLERQGGEGPGDTSTYRITLVDKLSKKGPTTGPLVHDAQVSEKGPKRVRKGSGLSDTIPRSLDTDNARARENEIPNPFDGPDITPPEEVADHVAGLRAALRKPKP